MRKHTTLNIDPDLLRAAQAVLGTTGTTDTVHRALAAVVQQYWRQWLIDNPVDLTADELAAMRSGRALPISSSPRQQNGLR